MVNRHTVGKTLGYIFLAVSNFVMICPALYMALGTFTSNDRINTTVYLPIPNALLDAFNLGILKSVWESLRQAHLVTMMRVGFYELVTVAVGLIDGYLFAKVRFPGRDQVFLLMLSGLVMPAILTILPQFILMARFPLVGGNDIWGQGGHGLAGEWPVFSCTAGCRPLPSFSSSRALTCCRPSM